jgi:hypothetical protein
MFSVALVAYIDHGCHPLPAIPILRNPAPLRHLHYHEVKFVQPINHMIELKDITPRAQLEILRLYLQWRVREVSEPRTDAARRKRLGIDRSVEPIPQEVIAVLCGVSLGEINRIVHRKSRESLRQAWPEILRWAGHDMVTGPKAAFAWFTSHAEAQESARYERAHAVDEWSHWADYDDRWLERQARIAKRPMAFSALPKAVTEAIRLLEEKHDETREALWLQTLVDIVEADPDRSARALVHAALELCPGGRGYDDE